MTKKQKFLYIRLPIFIFGFIINFYVKDDNSSPPVREYKFNDFEKTEYQVKHLTTGDPLGEFHLSGDDNIYFSMYGKANSVPVIIGTIEEKYKYESILLSKKNIKKIKCKNLEFYTGKVGDWHSVVIISLDKNDYYEYYRSDNKRYLLCVIKNSDYNFCINDASVYDLYIGFRVDSDMRYAAILE